MTSKAQTNAAGATYRASSTALPERPVIACFRSSDSESVRRIDELIHDVDQRLRQGGKKLLATLRRDVDALAGDLERLEFALAV